MRLSKKFSLLALVAVTSIPTSFVLSDPIYLAPGFTTPGGGYGPESITFNPSMSVTSVGGVGIAIGQGSPLYGPGTAAGPSGTRGTILASANAGYFFSTTGYQPLSSVSGGASSRYADTTLAINSAGTTVVGYATQYTGASNGANQYAATWDISGGTGNVATITYLPVASNTVDGATGASGTQNPSAKAIAINASGTIAGIQNSYVLPTGSSSLASNAPSVWVPSGGGYTSSLLTPLGSSPTAGYTGTTTSINSSGYIVGQSTYGYSGTTNLGTAATVWNASNPSAPTQLTAPSTDFNSTNNGGRIANATVLNDANVAAGSTRIYTGSTTSQNQPIRWNDVSTPTG